MNIFKNIWCMIFHRNLISTYCEGENCDNYCPVCNVRWGSRR